MNNHQRSSATSQIYAENDEDKEINRYARRTKLYVSEPRISNIGHDFMLRNQTDKSKSKVPQGGADLCFCGPQPNTSRSCKTTDKGLVHRSLLINRPRRDGTLSWRWYTAVTGGIRTLDLAITNPTLCHTATVHA